MNVKTELTKATREALERAGRIIREGGLVGFPTETVYGLGGNALDGVAAKAIFEAKGRPGDNPLIVHVCDVAQIPPLIDGDMPEAAQQLAEAYWPGPMTLIMKKSAAIPTEVSAGLDTVGIRIPSNPDARALIASAGVPIAAPSGNRSGRPSPTQAAHMMEDMDGRIPMILDGGPCTVGLESSVIDCTVFPPRVLRPGGVTPHMIAEACGAVEVDGSVLRALREDEKPRSPGMKYRHYAPKGAVTIVTGHPGNVEKRILELATQARDAGKTVLILALDAHVAAYEGFAVRDLGDDAAQMANRLFDLLRYADEIGADAVFSKAVEAEELGLAVMNRLGRAAAFHVVNADEAN